MSGAAPPPLRVLQVVDDLERGGAQAIVLAAARLVDPARVEMRVAGLSGRLDAALAREVRAACAQLVVLGARGLWDVRAVGRLARLIGRAEVDVVHTHLAHSDVLGGLAARLTGRPAVSTLHAVAADRMTLPRRRRLAADAATRHLNRHLVAVSDAVRDSHSAALGLPSARIAVLHNVPVAPLLLPPGFDAAQARAELGLGPGPVVCVAARLALPKDHDTLVRALPAVLERHPELTVLVAGDGPRRDELVALARALRVDDAVRFLGVRADVPRLLAVADVVCNLTHEAEGLSITVLDGMSLGRPVVATAVASVAEVVAHERTGMLVAPRDVAGAASALVALLDDASRRERIGRAAQAEVATRHDPGRWAAQLEGIYRDAAAGAGR